MKHFIITLWSILLTTQLLSQSPQAFNYQGVARDLSNNPITNRNIGLRISILQNSTIGSEVYKELHLTQTNQLGLFNIKIGLGTPVISVFKDINWSKEIHFLQIEMDENGGSNYQLIGTSQLLSVPYALHSKTTENVDDADADQFNEIQTISVENDSLRLSKSNSIPIDNLNYWKNLSQFNSEKNYSLKTEFGELSCLINPEGVTLNFDANSDRLNTSRIWEHGNGLDIFSPNGLTIWTQFNQANNTYSQPLIIQGNGNIKINGYLDFSNIYGGGFIMRSDNGKCWQYKADNMGQLIATSITCPN